MWSRPAAALCLCCCQSHLMHQPQTISESQSPQMAIPSGFSTNQPLLPSVTRGPSPNRRLALSPREDQTAAAWPEDHPSPSSHMLFPSHLYSDVHGRVAFVNFGRQAGNQWQSCGEKFILSSASIQGPVVWTKYIYVSFIL